MGLSSGYGVTRMIWYIVRGAPTSLIGHAFEIVATRVTVNYELCKYQDGNNQPSAYHLSLKLEPAPPWQHTKVEMKEVAHAP